jgi:hypothetical protein
MVAIIALAAFVFRVDVTKLSPFLIKVAIYKLAVIAAIALMAAGAALGRRGRSGTASKAPPR